MGLVCPADVDSIVGLWDLFVWLSLGLTMHSLFRLIYKNTKKDDYSAVASVAMFMPNEQLYHALTFFMMMTGCYANWRVYTCENWNDNPVGHALFFFWTLAMGLTHLGWITYDMSIFGALMFFVSMMFSICNIVFAWPHDFYSVIIHFILCFLCFGLCVVHLYLYANRKDYSEKVKKFRDFWEDRKQARLERDLDAAEEQASGTGEPLLTEEAKLMSESEAPKLSQIRQRSTAAQKSGDFFPVIHNGQ